MNEDKLTHAQRVRLEAFAQASQARIANGKDALEVLHNTFKVACLIEEWLWAADAAREPNAIDLVREARRLGSSY
jgi:hypothetical protein